MTEWIEDATEPPPMAVVDRNHLRSAGSNGPLTHPIRIIHDQQHTDATAAQRLWAEVQICRRLVGYPKLRALNSELRDDRPVWRVNTMDHMGAKRRLVELDCGGAPTHRQRRGDFSHRFLNSLSRLAIVLTSVPIARSDCLPDRAIERSVHSGSPADRR